MSVCKRDPLCSEVVTSRCHGSKMSRSQQSMVLQIWQKKTKKLNMYDFPVHDYTQDQNGSPYSFLCFNNENGRLYQERFLRSTNFVTMVTLVALLFFILVCNWLNIYHLRCLVMTGCS